MLLPSASEELHSALTNSFDRDELATLLRRDLDVNIERIVDTSQPFWGLVFKIIEIAEQAGWVRELIAAAHRQRGDNALLADLFRRTAGAAQNVTDSLPGDPSDGDASSLAARLGIPSDKRPDWQERWKRIASQVCRIEVAGIPQGTGVLVGPDIVLTSIQAVDQILQDRQDSSRIVVRFDVRTPRSEGLEVRLSQEWAVDIGPGPVSGGVSISAPASTSERPEYALLQLERSIGTETVPVAADPMAARGWVRLLEESPAFAVNSPIVIPHYAGTAPLSVVSGLCLLLERNPDDTRFRYWADVGYVSTGAPCFDLQWNFLALNLSYSSPSEGKPEFFEGTPAGAIRRRLNSIGKIGVLESGSTRAASLHDATNDSRPPPPGPIVDVNDLQKGRWGRRAQRQGRRVHAEFLDANLEFFFFDVIVTSTDDSALVGPVIFHLHDSYPRSAIRVKKIREGNRAVLEEVSARGVYTLGVQVRDARGDWIGLELNLARLKGLPGRFRSR